MQGKIPCIFGITFALAIIALTLSNFPRWDGSRRFSGLLLVGLYLIWLLLESVVAIGETGREKTHHDHGTCEVYALGRASVVISALAIPGWRSGDGLWIPVGIGIFLGGVSIRLWAIRVLGRSYSHRVRLPEDQKLITTGPYRMLRHPAYSGMLLSHIGLVIFFFNWVSLALLLGFLLPAIVVRIYIEEKALFAIRGYREAFERKKRLIPFCW